MQQEPAKSKLITEVEAKLRYKDSRRYDKSVLETAYYYSFSHFF